MKSNNSTIPPSCDHSLEAFAPDRPQLLALRRRCPTCRKMVQVRRDDTVILPEPELPNKSRIEWEMDAERLRVLIPSGFQFGVDVFLFLMGVFFAIAPFLPFVEKEGNLPDAYYYIVGIASGLFLIGYSMYQWGLERTIEFDRNWMILTWKSLGFMTRKEGKSQSIILISHDVPDKREDEGETLLIINPDHSQIHISSKLNSAEMKWLEQMLLQTQARLQQQSKIVAQ